MNNSSELYVVYTCDQTEVRPLLDTIVKSLPSLTATVQEESPTGKKLHYNETPEITSFGTFIDNNVGVALGDDRIWLIRTQAL